MSPLFHYRIATQNYSSQKESKISRKKSITKLFENFLFSIRRIWLNYIKLCMYVQNTDKDRRVAGGNELYIRLFYKNFRCLQAKATGKTNNSFCQKFKKYCRYYPCPERNRVNMIKVLCTGGISYDILSYRMHFTYRSWFLKIFRYQYLHSSSI